MKPSLWDILDRLNTGDYDDGLAGWINVSRSDGAYVVEFEPAEGAIIEYRLEEVGLDVVVYEKK